ncbi:glutamate-5-semialdehyde dehydrogenase [Fusibacter sp. A1]|uniref:glutamate-5-semialdehyde dehydrogenase n=2 Tax=Fusibacter TaxID=76008 RepID=UPI001011E124|nr:glutamate-5-semialdehyde dehydrogenase [Fusibacter sp. A1]MCK8059783.1 glutamate-5-semialdehyde dehydrogenase [Fusibacter sp. A2]NPE21584.1 glutamate-5-semialdehyde dehydrogenase [Fusibacter sp. A1]RXV62105.1 glutamate-5-semialdehyde dehydrogenase [Fusibacter sp. A1]
MSVLKICELAKQASYRQGAYKEHELNTALLSIAEGLRVNQSAILKENEKDIQAAIKAGMSQVMLDRLKLTGERVLDMAAGVTSLTFLKSSHGKVLESKVLENGLTIEKRSVPFGVIGMIYESRPNVTVDAAAIAIKTGNAIVLKGGKEAIHTNRILVEIMKEALESNGIRPDAIGFIDSVDRTAAAELLTMRGYIDILIPRGSAGLINWVTKNAQVPVIETGAGNCHIYVDKDANFTMALAIIKNAKTQRPSVCNAAEKVLVHKEIAESFLAALAREIGDKVTFRVDPLAKAYLKESELMLADEYFKEYLDYILGIGIVDDVYGAVDWINRHSTHHSDAIITDDTIIADYFLNIVDSAAVYHNASTRFTDGAEFGFGAEIGIATSKIHARGPMGLNEMTTYKYVVIGNGQIRG